jgi:hypothetical protein
LWYGRGSGLTYQALPARDGWEKALIRNDIERVQGRKGMMEVP